MINKRQFLDEVITVALKYLDPEIPHSPAAEQLLMGTAMQESRLTYIRQLAGGPALGFFQMEPNTHDDIWENFLAYQARLRIKIQKGFGSNQPFPDDLITDLMYAAVMCRVHYWRRPEALPEFNDIAGQAAYWKQFYNTPQGHGTRPQYMAAWQSESLSSLWEDRDMVF